MIITICGTPGGGKSSVARALAKKLGYKYYSTGNIIRKLAVGKGITLVEFLKQCEKNPAPDKDIDNYLKELGEKEDDFVVESRLGFHFIPDSIKIFLDADLRVRAERVFEREHFEENASTVKEAMELIRMREETDVKRYEKLYGVNPFDTNHFDLVIDTSDNTVDQTTDQVYRFVAHKIKK